MAAPTGTFQTYQAIGDREDLSDIIYDISPTDTPFMSNVGRGKASYTLVEWQTDSLAAANADNAVIEGDDATTNTASPTTRFGNYCQIMQKVPRVAGTQRAVNSAGRRDELSYQIAKSGRELKRDMEARLTSIQGGAAGDSASARETAGLGAWLFGNQVLAANGGTAPTTGTAPTVASGVPTTDVAAGTAGTFLEDDLKTAISNCWDDGGDPTLIMVGSFNKKAASNFSGIGTQYRDVQPSPAAPGTIVGAADLYVSDFGTHQIVANRFQNSTVAYVLDLEYWEVSYLRPIGQSPLAKTGDSERRLINTEFALCAKNPDSSAMVSALTTS